MKIFGIGLSRTGTTSLHQALEILGYKAIHFPPFRCDWFGNVRIADEVLAYCDAFTDTPVCVAFRKLDSRFPQSKFILTRRDLGSWLSSCSRYSRFRNAAPGKHIRRLRRKLYGSVVFDAPAFEAAYSKYHDAVSRYFCGREQDLLVMDITRGDGWEKLCEFLSKPIPARDFPRAHVGSRPGEAVS